MPNASFTPEEFERLWKFINHVQDVIYAGERGEITPEQAKVFMTWVDSNI